MLTYQLDSNEYNAYRIIQKYRFQNISAKWWQFYANLNVDGILPNGPYPPCFRMADRALLAGYPQCVSGIMIPTDVSVSNVIGIVRITWSVL